MWGSSPDAKRPSPDRNSERWTTILGDDFQTLSTQFGVGGGGGGPQVVSPVFGSVAQALAGDACHESAIENNKSVAARSVTPPE
jgi:hypothetical protein